MHHTPLLMHAPLLACEGIDRPSEGLSAYSIDETSDRSSNHSNIESDKLTIQLSGGMAGRMAEKHFHQLVSLALIQD